MQRTIAGSYGIAVYLLQVQHTLTRPRGAVQQPKEDKSKGGKSLKALADGAPLTVHYTIRTHFGSALWPQSVLNDTSMPRQAGRFCCVRVDSSVHYSEHHHPRSLKPQRATPIRSIAPSHSLGAVQAVAMLPVVWLCGCAGGVRGSVAAAELTDADAPFVADGLLKAAHRPNRRTGCAVSAALCPLHCVRCTVSSARCPLHVVRCVVSVESAQSSARLRLRLASPRHVAQPRRPPKAALHCADGTGPNAYCALALRIGFCARPRGGGCAALL
jgi:hypothetical protein